MKTLNREQELYCAKIFNDYFGQFNRIDEYMRDQKMSQLNDTISASLPGMGPETEIFDNFDISPYHNKFVKLVVVTCVSERCAFIIAERY